MADAHITPLVTRRKFGPASKLTLDVKRLSAGGYEKVLALRLNLSCIGIVLIDGWIGRGTCNDEFCYL